MMAAQLHGFGARLPVAIAVAVALRQPVGRALAMRRAGLGADLHTTPGASARDSESFKWLREDVALEATVASYILGQFVRQATEYVR